MPHKRNPVLATLIRSAALQVPVLAAGVTQSMLDRGRALGRASGTPNGSYSASASG